MDSIILDFRYAIRSLAKKPGFTLVALLTLALGIGATTAMFSVLETALARSLPFPEADRLVLGRPTFSGRVGSLVSFPDYVDYRDRSKTLESLATIGGRAGLVTITGEGEPEQANITYATSNLFTTLGAVPHLGRFSTLDELPESGGGEVVISYTYWQQRFGGANDVLGRSLTVDGDPLTIVGVLPTGFHFFYDTDLWVPPWEGNHEPINRRYHNWIVVGRMAPGATLEAARAELDLISTQLASAYPESNRDKGLHLDELHSALVEGFRPSLLLLTGAIVLVLFIACANVANLLLARGSTRGSELAVRTALGATRSQLRRQLLVECLVLALVAGCLGVLFAVWIQKFILSFVSMDRLGILDAGISATMLGIAMVLSLITVLLFGLVPSFAVSRTNPAEDLKTGSRRISSGSGMRFRSALVVLQVALSVILLAGSGLLLRSYARLRGVDPGFRVENLLTATVALASDGYQKEDHQIQFFQELQKQIQSLPGVESVGLIDRLPILQTAGNVALWDTENPPETLRDALSADRRIVLPGFFTTMDIPLLEGRSLKTSDAAGSQRVIVLNRSTAEAIFPERSAIGRHVEVDLAFLEWSEPAIFEVVGVVEDYTLSSLGGRARRAMFFPLAQQPRTAMRLAVATNVDPSTLVRPIQERLWKLDRNIVLSNPQSMADVVSDSVAATRSIATVLILFAVAALTLAALGLHGVLAFFVSQRVPEIGIRVALGAGRAQVLRLVLSRGLMLVTVGLLLGTVVSINASRLLDGMLFQITATDPVCFAGAALLLAAIATTACLLPAWKALRVNPLEALRVE